MSMSLTRSKEVASRSNLPGQYSFSLSTIRAPVEASFVKAQRRQRSEPSSLPAHQPPSVRLANPVNYVPRITPITPFYPSDENLLRPQRDAYPLLSVSERQLSRLDASRSSLFVEHSQAESDSRHNSIGLPLRQRRSEHSPRIEDMAATETGSLRPPGDVNLTYTQNRPRHVQSQTSLRSQSQIASIPSNTGPVPPDVAQDLAWGPAHPCFPHFNPHVPIGSQEYLTTRVIRIRRDWMISGDLAPTFSNLYPEILDPLLSEQEFRIVISTINESLVKAFNPFSLHNWLDGLLGLLTGWIWDDLNAPGIKSQLQRVEKWIEDWNREVGSRDGVHIWSLRRTAYMSIDIQIPDPQVGMAASEGPSVPNTRPSSGVGLGN
ncbi:hypothetical protein N7495_006209 [Penicillium taxi]|uniref:uncharacterized protein n=1 Tax=Penicillium taxi TaxID=168475 RepID=UPI0025454E09|nr:uncharacterized protein N7495_006209 [Penicillium taxi]KAJ5894518.1 hypothetical protein N7495_006209 [Penicillium taxi]